MMKQRYPEWLKRLYQLLTADGDDIRFIVQKPIIDRLIKGLDARRILDCGCGLGLYLRTMANAGEEVWACDIQQRNLDYCRRHRNKKDRAIQFVHADIISLPFPDGYFDAILCSEVIEHVTDDRQALAELLRVLAPAGRLIISTPVPPGIVEEDAYGHKRPGYQPEVLRSMLVVNGARIISEEQCFFALSRATIGIIASWVRVTGFNAPRPVLVLVWLERLLGITARPYDQVLLAVKRDDADRPDR